MLGPIVFFRLMTLLGFALGGVSDDVRAETVTSPRVAQVRLAETLGEADAIHAVRAHGRRITFVITRGAQTIEVTATTRRGNGEVTALAIAPVAPTAAALGGLSWLADELEGATAVTRLVADEDGAVTVTTREGQRYMLIPGRGSGGVDGNAAVAARWAAAWD